MLLNIIKFKAHKLSYFAIHPWGVSGFFLEKSIVSIHASGIFIPLNYMYCVHWMISLLWRPSLTLTGTPIEYEKNTQIYEPSNFFVCHSVVFSTHGSGEKRGVTHQCKITVSDCVVENGGYSVNGGNITFNKFGQMKNISGSSHF